MEAALEQQASYSRDRHGNEEGRSSPYVHRFEAFMLSCYISIEVQVSTGDFSCVGMQQANKTRGECSREDRKILQIVLGVQLLQHHDTDFLSTVTGCAM